jgi:NAD(P)-dependent dehydrogenase (short-subunit alcohol dehydrogenase family)
MTENGRVALVSGGNRGIGLEIVRQLAGRGITVILGSREEESGRAAAEGLSGDVVVSQLDVTDEGSVARLAASVEGEFGRLDILVNNAGDLERRRPARHERRPGPRAGSAGGQPLWGLAVM